MVWWKRRWARSVSRKARYIARELGVEKRFHYFYEDDKIIIRSGLVFCEIFLKDDHHTQVFNYKHGYHPYCDVYRYGRWVNYLWSLSKKADQAWLETHRKEKAQQRLNFSDIDDSKLFGEEFAIS